MGDRIIKESKTTTKKQLIKYLITSCDIDIYKLEYIKADTCVLANYYGLTQQEAVSIFNSIRNIDKILKEYRADLVKMKKECKKKEVADERL